jgi:hypothetical protein
MCDPKEMHMPDDPKKSGEEAQISSPTDPAKEGSEDLTVELENPQMILIGLAQLR